MDKSEQIIIACAEIHNGLEALQRLYQSIVLSVDREKEAIGAGNLQAIEDISRQKSHLANEIESSMLKLQGHADTLFQLCGQESSSRLSLGQLIGRVDGFLSGQPDNLQWELARHQFSKLQKAHQQLHQLRRESDGRITQNKYLLTRLLTNYRMSHRFWINVLSELGSTYTAKGAKQESKGSSFLQIKA